MRVRFAVSTAVTLSALLLLSACGSGSSEGHEDKDAKLARALVGPIRPGTCSLDSNRKSADPPEDLPAPVSDKCVWQARGEYIGQSPHAFVVLRETDEELQLRGFHPTNGSRLWQSKSVGTKRPDDDKKQYEKKAREQPRMVRSGDSVYVALFTTVVTPEDAVRDEKEILTLRFAPVQERGRVELRKYTAPEGFEVFDTGHDAFDSTLPQGRVLLHNKESDEYLIVDPASAEATPFTPSDTLGEQAVGEWSQSSEEIVTALADGSVLSITDTSRNNAGKGSNIIVRNADGSVRWTSSRTAPSGVNAGEAALSGIVGSHNDQLVLWWRSGSHTDTRDTYDGRDGWRKRPLVIAVHDARSGRVVMTHQRDFNGRTRTSETAAVSVTGRYAISAGVTLDLHENTALSTAPQPLVLTHISSSGTGYGVGNHDRTVSIDTATGKLLSDEEDGPEPIAASRTTLLFEKRADRKKYIIAFPFKD